MTSAASSAHADYASLKRSGSTRAVIVSSSEFALKSAPVRRRLQSQLTEHLKLILRRHGFRGVNSRIQGAQIVLETEGDAEEAAEVCSRVFGVAWAASAIVVPAQLDPIESACLELGRANLRDGGTFAVRAKRSSNAALSSNMLEVRLGRKLLETFASQGLRVDLRRPNFTIHVDVAFSEAFVYSTRKQGPAGLPIGSQGKMLGTLTSLSPSSLVAFHLMMRRGASIVPVSFVDPQETIQHLLPLRLLLPKEKFRFWHVDGVDAFLKEAQENTQAAGDLSVLAERLRLRILNELVRRERAIGIVDTQSSTSAADFHGMMVTAGLALVPIHRPLVGLQSSEIDEYVESLGLGSGVLVEHTRNIIPPPEHDVDLGAISRAETALHVESRAHDLSLGAQRILVPLEAGH